MSELSVNIDEVIIVYLKDDIIMGAVKAFNTEKVTLIDSYDYETGEKCGTQHINRSDIQLIQTLCSETKASDAKGRTSSNFYDNINNIPNAKERHIRRLLSTIIFIDRKDDVYDNAIKDLWEKQIIYVVIDDNRFMSAYKEPIITITTNQQVYIFDMKILGKCFDLSEIFSAFIPKKIVYNAPSVIEQFKMRTNMKLRSVFDVQTGLLKYAPSLESEDLVSCIQSFLDIPGDLYPTHSDNLDIRPLNDKQKLNAAIISLFLQYFNDCLMHHTMLKDFYEQCSKFSDYYTKQGNVHVIARELHDQEKEAANGTFL